MSEQYTVGQTLWFESAVRYRTSGHVEVEKVGRKWVTLKGHWNGRFDIDTGRLDNGGSGTSPGKVWPNRESAEEEKALHRAWQALVNRMRGRWEPPIGVTTKDIQDAKKLLFPPRPGDDPDQEAHP